MALAALIGLILVLVRFKPRRTIVPFVLIGLAVLVIAIDDGSFLGGVRPFDGGDDGLFYDGVGRMILQKLLAGDFCGFLHGGEKVFYYGGPGLRYFRALEHVVFGESYLGYLSLVLLLPFLVFGLFRRFLPSAGRLPGVHFLSRFRSANCSARPLSTTPNGRRAASPIRPPIFCLSPAVRAGRRRDVVGPERQFFAGVFRRAASGARHLHEADCRAGRRGFAWRRRSCRLHYRQWRRLAGLCIGFLPVFSMALHNWVFGHVFVLFSANAADSDLLVMPPSAYVAAFRELFALDFSGAWTRACADRELAERAGRILLDHSVECRRRRHPDLCRGPRPHFDPWLRLIGAAALAQHAVALFYIADIARYHFLTWFFTMLVVMVLMQRSA